MKCSPHVSAARSFVFASRADQFRSAKRRCRKRVRRSSPTWQELPGVARGVVDTLRRRWAAAPPTFQAAPPAVAGR